MQCLRYNHLPTPQTQSMTLTLLTGWGVLGVLGFGGVASLVATTTGMTDARVTLRGRGAGAGAFFLATGASSVLAVDGASTVGATSGAARPRCTVSGVDDDF